MRTRSASTFRHLLTALALSAGLVAGLSITTPTALADVGSASNSKGDGGSRYDVDPDYADGELNNQVLNANEAAEQRDNARQRAYQEAIARMVAQQADANAAYLERLAQWRRDVDACNGGDYSRCDNQAPDQ